MFNIDVRQFMPKVWHSINSFYFWLFVYCAAVVLTLAVVWSLGFPGFIGWLVTWFLVSPIVAIVLGKMLEDN